MLTKIIKYVAISLAAVSLSSCHDYLDKLNTNPVTMPEMNPNYQLTYIQLMTWGDLSTCEPMLNYMLAFSQIYSGEWNVSNWGGQYRRKDDMMSNLWSQIYLNSMKNIVDVLHNTAGDPSKVNVNAAMKIFKVYYGMILTDAYGDVPYSDAGLAFYDRKMSPKYDKQKDIYYSFFTELEEAEAALTADGDALTGDIVFNGSIDQWKRFANSLRLRAAMRLVKVEPETAIEQINKIIANGSGFLQSGRDAMVKYQDIFDWENAEIRRNGMSQFLRRREIYPEAYFCSVFFDKLINTGDPRTFRICRTYFTDDEVRDKNTPANWIDQDPWSRFDGTDLLLEQWMNDPAYPATDIDNFLFQPVDPGFYSYSPWPSKGIYIGNYNGEYYDAYIMKGTLPQLANNFLWGSTPGFLMTYAEVQMLLAEAKVRWGGQVNISESAETLYENGIRGSMAIFANYKDMPPITESEITDYLDANPLPSFDEGKLQTICEQLWVMSFVNGPEAYATWRRTGYPQLRSSAEWGAPVYESSTIPRRFFYPLQEAAANPIEFGKAIAEFGGKDTWNARVWWDKQ